MTSLSMAYPTPGVAALRSVSLRARASRITRTSAVVDLDAPEPRIERVANSSPARDERLDCVTLAHVASAKMGAESAYQAFDDAALGKLIAERDSVALEQLYDRHGSACYGLARRIVADEQLAHDVVQDVLLAIWKGSATYDGTRGSLTTWLFALTHHKSVDAVRRAQRHSGRRAPEEALETEPDLSPGVEEQALESLRRDRVRSALATLPDAQREALLLAYFGGYTQSEIAAMTNTPLGTVKTRTLAALRRLRGMLGDAQFPTALGEGEGA
jgi:RNA polymerase sigma factor (sigma-70 family)